MRNPGCRACSCAARRRLEVPTTASGDSSSSEAYRVLTKASRASARVITAARSNPSGRSIGTSLSECTASSARPSNSATSSSLVNSPLPPISASGRSRIWSPRVVMPSSATSAAGWRARSSSATWLACQRASRLSRVAMRRGAEKADSVMRRTLQEVTGCQAASRQDRRVDPASGILGSWAPERTPATPERQGAGRTGPCVHPDRTPGRKMSTEAGQLTRPLTMDH